MIIIIVIMAMMIGERERRKEKAALTREKRKGVLFSVVRIDGSEL